MIDTTTTGAPPDLLEAEGIWRHVFSYHPFAVELERAEGIYLYDRQGNRYIDASGGPMSCNIGHGDPRMRAAIAAQLDRFAYCHPVLAHRERAELCAGLAAVAPGGFAQSFLVSGGSEAVETALKIARQHHYARGNHGKHKVIACHESYHGMTFATMALAGNPGYQRLFGPMMPSWPHVLQYSDRRRPAGIEREEWGIACARELERTIYYEHPNTIAAFIATPHGCGSEYGVVPPASYWREVRRICDQYDVLLIADEVVTGFGRTGRWFAMEHFGVVPDLITVAKGISGSQAPLGAVLVSDRVAAPFNDGATFVHGFTNQGHPLACAAGTALLEILKADRLVERAAELSPRLFAHHDRLLSHPTVIDVRGWGLFLVLELVESKETGEYFGKERHAEQLFQALALQHGLAFYSALYGPRRTPALRRGLPLWVSPPLHITGEQIDDLMARLDQTLSAWELALGVGA